MSVTDSAVHSDPTPREHPRESIATYDFWFGAIDARPLGLFRVAFGLFLVANYVDMLPDVTAFFTDQGFLPRWALSQYSRPYRYSLMDGIGSAPMAYLFLSAAILTALLLAAGLRTRWVAVINFVFLLSVQERCFLVTDGSDTVSRTLAFWLMFADSGRALSLDAVRAAARGRPLAPLVPALPVRILQLQVTIIYFFSFLEKIQGETWLEGTALYYALHLGSPWVHGLGERFADVPLFTLTATYLTLVFEFLFFSLVFIPFAQPRAKAVALVSGLLFHLGILTMMKVGWFSTLMPLTYLLFFEGTWVRGLLDRIARRRSRPSATIAFDPESRLSSGAAEAVGRLDVFGRFAAVPEATTGAGVPREALFALRRPGREDREGFDALSACARWLPAAWPVLPLLYLPGARRLGRSVWARAAERDRLRRELGLEEPRAEAAELLPPLLPDAVRGAGRWALRVALLTVFAMAATYALAGVFGFRRPLPVVAVVEYIGLWQAWGMFAPNPLGADVRIEVQGKLATGEEVDLVRAGYAQGGWRPHQAHHEGLIYSRWVKLTEVLIRPNTQAFTQEYARFICKTYNADPAHADAKLATLEIIAVVGTVPKPGEEPAPPKRTVLWQHRCY